MFREASQKKRLLNRIVKDQWEFPDLHKLGILEIEIACVNISMR